MSYIIHVPTFENDPRITPLLKSAEFDIFIVFQKNIKDRF